MAAFAIASCQVTWGVGYNLDNMRREIALTKARFPWVDMVMFGELVPFVPLIAAAGTVLAVNMTASVGDR
jgi:deaminated glutathione amidase